MMWLGIPLLLKLTSNNRLFASVPTFSDVIMGTKLFFKLIGYDRNIVDPALSGVTPDLA
jgi:hypothetical protein